MISWLLRITRRVRHPYLRRDFATLRRFALRIFFAAPFARPAAAPVKSVAPWRISLISLFVRLLHLEGHSPATKSTTPRLNASNARRDLPKFGDGQSVTRGTRRSSCWRAGG